MCVCDGLPVRLAFLGLRTGTDFPDKAYSPGETMSDEPQSELEKHMNELSQMAIQAKSHSKEMQKVSGQIRRKSRDLSDDLSQMMQATSETAWGIAGAALGKNRQRRNSRDFNDEELTAAFNKIDTDSNGNSNGDY